MIIPSYLLPRSNQTESVSRPPNVASSSSASSPISPANMKTALPSVEEVSSGSRLHGIHWVTNITLPVANAEEVTKPPLTCYGLAMDYGSRDATEQVVSVQNWINTLLENT